MSHGCAPTPVCGSLVGLNVAPPSHFRNERVLFRAWALRDRAARRDHGGAGALAPPLPGCLRRRPRQRDHGRPLARRREGLRRLRGAQPLRRRLPSPLAQMGRTPDRHHLHQPPPTSADQVARDDQARTHHRPTHPRHPAPAHHHRPRPHRSRSTRQPRPAHRQVHRSRTPATPPHRRARPDHRPQHRPDRQRQRGRRPGPRPQGRLRAPPRQHPYPGSNYIPDLWWRGARLLVEVDSRE